MIIPDYNVDENKNSYTIKEVFFAASKHFKFDLVFPKGFIPKKFKDEYYNQLYSNVTRRIRNRIGDGYTLLGLQYSHAVENSHHIDSCVVDVLINNLMFKYFIDISIRANIKCLDYNKKDLGKVDEELQKNKYNSSNELQELINEKNRVEMIIEGLENTIEELKDSLKSFKQYKKLTTPKYKEKYFEKELLYSASLHKDIFAEKVYKVLSHADIPINVVYSDITPEEAERIRKLPQDIKDEYIARYHRIRGEEIDSIIDEIVNKTKYEIVSHYIMNHCIEIDMDKLRKSVEAEYLSDENPENFYKYINRIKLKDLSNYYTIKRKR